MDNKSDEKKSIDLTSFATDAAMLTGNLLGGKVGSMIAGALVQNDGGVQLMANINSGIQSVMNFAHMNSADLLKNVDSGVIVNAMIPDDGAALTQQKRNVLGEYIALSKQPHIAKLMEEAKDDPEIGQLAKDQMGFDPNGGPMELVDKIKAMDSDALKEESDKIKGYATSPLLKGAAMLPKGVLSSMAGFESGFNGLGDMFQGFMKDGFSMEGLSKFFTALMDKVSGMFGKLTNSFDLKSFGGGEMASQLGGFMKNTLGAGGFNLSMFDPTAKPIHNAYAGAPGALPDNRPDFTNGPKPPTAS